MKCVLVPATALVMESSQNHNHRVSDMDMVEKGAARLVSESSCVRLIAKKRNCDVHGRSGREVEGGLAMEVVKKGRR
jgi:hypothetical protein